MSNFTQFGLSAPLMKAISEMGYSQPTPIQEQAIPKILEGVDVRASARTGTGKTAAFLLPAIQQLCTSQEKKKRPTVLILVPTRELAIQVAGEAKKYTKHLPHIQTVCIYGGMPYPVQNKMLMKRYNILVATPGRLLDHMDRGRIDLSDIQFLVLDEADRMLDMGFIDDVEKIVRSAPKSRQTLLFSATLDGSILPISQRLQNNPFEIRIETPIEEKHPVEQHIYYVDGLSHKVQILEHLLSTLEFNQTLVFTSTISQADELSEKLQEMGHHAASLHGDMSQRQRTRTIERVRKGSIKVLVATDVAARGIDIATVSHVFNFDLPMQIENYVHRIGRTGRAGAEGLAISFVSHREEALLVRIKKLTSLPMETKTIEGMEPKGKPSRRSREGGSRGHFGSRRPRESFGRRSEGGFRDRKPARSFEKQDVDGNREERRPRRSFEGQSSTERPFEERRPRRSFEGQSSTERPFEERRPRRTFEDRKPEGERSFSNDRPRRSFGEKKPGGFFKKRPGGSFGGYKKREKPSF